MDDLIPFATPSVYHSAHSSSNNSPDDFRTPFSTWQREEEDLDTITPRATVPPTSLTLQSVLVEQIPTDTPSTTSPLLERYINSRAAVRTTYTLPIPTTDDMPVSTRLRKRSAQPSPSVSSPTRTGSSSTIQADLPTITTHSPTTNPLVTENLLRDLSPHSPTYASHLEQAVDSVVRSLMERGQVKQGHGMRELYMQSFKDPGSAELLDALLRQRATDRQYWDFERYVEDVNRLSCQPPVVVIPTREKKPGNDVPETPVRGVGREDVGVDGTPGTLEIPSTIKRKPPSPRVVIEVSSVASQSSQPHSESSTHNTTTAQVSQHRDHRKQRRRRRRERLLKLSRMPEIPEESDAEQTTHKTNATGNTPQKPIHPVTAAQKSRFSPTEPLAVTTQKANLQHLHERRRKKKRREKMFAGANGPVYSGNALGITIAGQQLWR